MTLHFPCPSCSAPIPCDPSQGDAWYDCPACGTSSPYLRPEVTPALARARRGAWSGGKQADRKSPWPLVVGLAVLCAVATVGAKAAFEAVSDPEGQFHQSVLMRGLHVASLVAAVALFWGWVVAMVAVVAEWSNRWRPGRALFAGSVLYGVGAILLFATLMRNDLHWQGLTPVLASVYLVLWSSLLYVFAYWFRVLVRSVLGAPKVAMAGVDAALALNFFTVARSRGWFADAEGFLPPDRERLRPVLLYAGGFAWVLQRDEVVSTPICRSRAPDAENLLRLFEYWRKWKGEQKRSGPQGSKGGAPPIAA